MQDIISQKRVGR